MGRYKLKPQIGYAEKLVNDILKIENTNEELAIKCAITCTLKLINDGGLSMHKIRHQEEILRDLTSMLSKIK